MDINKKPTRKDLLKVIDKLQELVGSAHHLHANDRNRMGFEDGQKKLEEAHELCIVARSFDKPT